MVNTLFDQVPFSPGGKPGANVLVAPVVLYLISVIAAFIQIV